MSKLKRIGCLVMVFMSGGIAFLHASLLKFGPAPGVTHEGNPWKLAFACFLALMFGTMEFNKEK